MTDPQAILAGVLREHHPKPIWCKCGWTPGLSLNDTESDRNQTYWHVATLQAAALAEWLQTFRDQRLDDRDIFCPECADNGLAVLADEFGATP